MAKQENRNTLSTSVLVRRFLPYFRKYRKTMAFDLCCAALTTIKGADCIWVLTEKGVEEQGSHTELIAKGGLYAHLFAMYTSDR